MYQTSGAVTLSKVSAEHFEKIVASMEKLVRLRQHYEERAWIQKSQALGEEKLLELTLLALQDQFVSQNFTFDDIWLFLAGFLTVGSAAAFKQMTRKRIRKFLEDFFLSQSRARQFFFPANLSGFPEGFKIGLCEVRSFFDLPYVVKNSIQSEEEQRLASKLDVHEKYLATQVSVIGEEKAIDEATARANQTFNILQCFFRNRRSAPDLPPERHGYWTASRSNEIGEIGISYGTRHADLYEYRYSAAMNRYIRILNSLVRASGRDEIAKRCLAAIDIYGMANSSSQIELKFLLSVIAIESLIVDTEPITSKLRERTTFLLGDSPVWMREFLHKERVRLADRKRNRIEARIALDRLMKEIYSKRSAFAHAGIKDQITVSDLISVSQILEQLLMVILNLYDRHRVTSLAGSGNSLDSLITRQKYSTATTWT